VDLRVIGFDIHDDPASLPCLLEQVEFVYHLAGVNRPVTPEEFRTGNAELTEQICRYMTSSGRKIPLAISSSTQAALENPYGVSKRQAEDLVVAYGQGTGAAVYVFRLANVFGKWCRPNYNSGVATFCHSVARDLPIQVADPNTVMKLVYVDDVVRAFGALLDGIWEEQGGFCVVDPVHTIKLGDVVELILSFRASRAKRCVPDMSNAFERKLYSTYLSYLPTDEFSYPLKMNSDGRGSFTEFIKTADRGQVSINVSKVGVTKGNHFHHSKSEKFLVVSGQGVIMFRRVGSDEVFEYQVSGERLEVVDIPAGYVHSISNRGPADLVTVMWCNEAFDPERPDTYAEPVDLVTVDVSTRPTHVAPRPVD
jgi:UDP-2-acetamido-2,6-beta-L-arabino-hexul-4-ose reductase